MDTKWFLVGGSAVVSALALILWDQRATMKAKAEFPPMGEKRFPTVRGASLSRQAYALPEDLEGRINILMIAFKRRHQYDINTWLPVAQDLAGEYEEVAYYELPVIQRLNPVARSLIDNGMRAGIPDPVARATTITLYVDKDAFMRSLDLTTDEQIYVLLVDRTGKVMWRTEGRQSEEAASSLRNAIAAARGQG